MQGIACMQLLGCTTRGDKTRYHNLTFRDFRTVEGANHQYWWLNQRRRGGYFAHPGFTSDDFDEEDFDEDLLNDNNLNDDNLETPEAPPAENLENVENPENLENPRGQVLPQPAGSKGYAYS